jgi:hypothetical protein
MMFQVEEAKREKLDAAIALIGPSGSGKTLSALFIAYGMMKTKHPDLEEAAIWKKIGLADTEHNRSKVYAHSERIGVPIGGFRHIDFKAPYSPSRYKEAVKALKKAGVETVIIDSLSHAWEGEGGLLDMQQKYGGTFAAWNKVKPDIQDFIKTLTQSDLHVIGTMRTKQDYVIETSELGKQNIKKVGLKTIQKDDLEYEFQIVFAVDMDHNTRVSKDNSGIYDGKTFKIDPEVGKNIYEWLELGIDVKAQEREKIAENAKRIHAIVKLNKIPELTKYLEELEAKANAPVEDFPITLSDRALLLVENKTIDLGGKLK